MKTFFTRNPVEIVARVSQDAKVILDAVMNFLAAILRVIKELPLLFLAWLGFSMLVTLGTYIVLTNTANGFITKYVPLAIIVLMPISYFLCGYIGYRTRPVRVASVVSTKLTAAEHEFQKVNYYFKSPASAGWVGPREQLTEYVVALSIANTPVRIEIVRFRLGSTRDPEEQDVETLGLANSVVNRADSFPAATPLVSG